MRQHAVLPRHHARTVRKTSVPHLFRWVLDRYLLLPLGVLIAMIWANSAPASYFTFSYRLAFVVNEIGMAFFFALITQEMAEAMMPGGSLHSWRRWGLSIAASAGGVAGATLAYLACIHFQYESILSPAWQIALAIDAVASYYVLKGIIGLNSALPFAIFIAITTDVLAVVLVAPQHLVLQTRAGGAALTIVGLSLAAVLRRYKVRAFWPYLCGCGSLMWLAFYWEGLHPAFALIPLVPFLPREARHRQVFEDPRDDDVIHHREHEWFDLVQLIVFFFGLVNGGVISTQYDTGSSAILVASLVGRPLGILVAVWIAVSAGLHLPRHIGWREVLVVAFAASSGFSVALFLATGLFAPGPLLAQIKIGVLVSAAGLAITVAIARALKVGRFGR